MDDRAVEERLLNMLERLESSTMSQNVKLRIMSIDINETDNTPEIDDASTSTEFAEQCMFLGWYILTHIIDYS
jgi:hypothetical protein